jgi:25S rRNA (adenine2142-N1)-methyltransferase
MAAQKSRKHISLTRGRPPSSKPPSLSSKATRSLIRSHHQLQKSHSQALTQGDGNLAKDLEIQIAAQGGLQSYQLASKAGQSVQRGGDSSSVLVGWLKHVFSAVGESGEKLRVLEVGALSARNAISRVLNCEVTRIDLNAQEKGILQQDFMERPLPVIEGDKFHIVSLSLVLNYVPDATGRGDMLRRTTEFLCQPKISMTYGRIPCVFLVLPAACVTNSRYLTEERLEEIVGSLGYDLVEKKISAKLIYYLLHFDFDKMTKGTFKKVKFRPGGQRNNFAIILR